MSVELAGARLILPHGVERAPLVLHDGLLTFSITGGTRTRIPLDGHLVLPAFLNAHDHLTLNALPCPARIPPQGNSYDWSDRFRPFFSHPDFARARSVDEGVRAVHGGLKNVLSGALTVAHHDPWLPAFEAPDFPVRVLRDSGWCHSLRYAGTYGPDVAASHAATPPGRPWFLHLAEGTDVVAKGELAELEALSALDERTVIVHGVGLSPADQERLLAAGASVVWCPKSNLFMLGRTLDPRRLAGSGRLALATDSRFTGSIDLLDEMRVARDASDLVPREILALVTENAARVMRVEGRGRIAEGAPADLLVVRDPGGDPYQAVLELRRADLRAIVRDGTFLIADPDLASALGGPWRSVALDGVRKSVRPGLLSDATAVSLEPGLTIEDA